MDPMRAEHLLRFGTDLVEQKQYAEARPPLREAVTLYQTLIEQDPTYRDKLAKAFVTLGVSLVPLDQFAGLTRNLDSPDRLAIVFESLSTSELEEALNAEQSALTLYRTLATEDASTYRSKAAHCLGLMGIILMLLRRDHAEVVTALNEAIAIYEACVVEDPSCVPLLDQTRQFLVVAAQLSEALGVATSPQVNELIAVIENLRPLAASDPVIRPRLAEALAMLGGLLAQEERHEDALQALQEASEIYGSLTNEAQTYGPKLVLTLSEVSKVFTALGRRQEALNAARDVVNRCRNLAATDSVSREDRAMLVLSLLGAGETLDELELHEEALVALSDAVALARSLVADHDGYREHLAQVLLGLGFTLHSLERETEMLHVFEEADQLGIPIFSEWFPEKRPGWEHLARVYLALADPAYLERAIEAATGKEEQIQQLLKVIQHGGPDEERDVLERIKATSLIQELWRDGRHGETLTVELLARFLMMRPMEFHEQWSPGEHPRWLGTMEENANRMVQICVDLHDEPCRALSLFYRATAIFLSLEENTPDAINDMEGARDIYRSLVKRFPAYRSQLATILNQLGTVYSQQDQVERAVTTLEEAVDVYHTLAGEDPVYQLELIRSLSNLGIAYINPAQGAQKLGEALNLLTLEMMEEQPEARASRIEILVNMSALAWLEDRYSAAMKCNDEALKLYRSFQDDKGAHHIRVGIRLLNMRGVLLQEMGNADKEDLYASYDVLKEAVGLFEKYFVELPWQDDQLHFLSREGNVYQQIVRTCLLAAEASESDDGRREWQCKAWQYTERSRARLTLQTLIQTTVDASAAASPRMQAFKDWARLNNELARLNNELRRGLDRSEANRQAILGEIAKAHKKLHKDHPDLEAITKVPDFDLDAVQQQLRQIPDGALLVEFFPLLDSLVLFLLDGEELRVEQAAITPNDLHTLTHQFRSSRDEQPDERELDRALTELGSRLTDLLTTHLTELPTPSTDTPDRVPHVLLLPTADLHLWPLHALPLGDGTRLIDHYAVSLLPAAAALPMLATQEVLRGPYHGFAPPINYFGLALSQIYTEAAILGETRNLDAVLHKGAEATLGALHKVRGGVLSFVTHASADVDAPERSGVQLAAREGPDILEWVTALEFLVGLDQLRCELLLLWGCQTHGSGAQSGDNWLGISRSFLRAGRTLVSSLWSIDITTTVLLSVEFMQGLVEGLTVPQAMRRAMRMVQRADLTKLKEWTQVIEKALPNEERNELISAWKNELGLTAAEYGYTITPPTKLKQLKQWAPYVTIGWPGTLSMVERK